MKLTKILLFFTFSFFYINAVANFIPEVLSPEEIARLDQGEIVLHKKNIKDLTWPELTIYLKIDASPLESVAIFYALDHQKNYIPNLIKSDVVKEETPTRVYAQYELKLPWPIPNSKYLHGHELAHLKTDEDYVVKWWMVESSSTKKVEGQAAFEPYKNSTVMIYRSIVEPKSFFASFVESNMISDVQKSLIATKEEIIRTKKEDQNLLNKYVSFIQAAFSGKFSYIKN